jgi:cytochrome P450
VFAGLVATTNAVASALSELNRRPALRRMLKDAPVRDGLWLSAVEELLRFVCPVQAFSRTARTDATVCDKLVKARERV